MTRSEHLLLPKNDHSGRRMRFRGPRLPDGWWTCSMCRFIADRQPQCFCNLVPCCEGLQFAQGEEEPHRLWAGSTDRGVFSSCSLTLQVWSFRCLGRPGIRDSPVDLHLSIRCWQLQTMLLVKQKVGSSHFVCCGSWSSISMPCRSLAGRHASVCMSIMMTLSGKG